MHRRFGPAMPFVSDWLDAKLQDDMFSRCRDYQASKWCGCMELPKSSQSCESL